MSTGKNFSALKGLIVLLGATTVEQTGLTVGRTYQFTVVGGVALVRWDTSAAVASDGNFDFAVVPGQVVYAVARDTMVNIIELDSSSSATAAVAIAEVHPY